MNKMAWLYRGLFWERFMSLSKRNAASVLADRQVWLVNLELLLLQLARKRVKKNQ